MGRLNQSAGVTCVTPYRGVSRHVTLSAVTDRDMSRDVTLSHAERGST